ncbi:MAG: AAA family ATPase, partial [Petrimonas sp.]|nr:AAA family ATPase [Petrimonas sp.]
IIPFFKNYLKNGYYPIYREGVRSYFNKITNIINTTLEKDLPSVEKIDYNGIYNVKKLLMVLATLVPYTPNIEKLSAEMQLNRASTLKYLHYLNKAALTNQLLVPNKGMSLLTKPEKVYLNNTNLIYTLNPDDTTISTGNIRETFFFNQLKVKHAVNLPKQGDFLIDKKYMFEVGGKNKSFEQIKDVKNSFVVIDDVEIGAQNKIPLWLFGLMY